MATKRGNLGMVVVPAVGLACLAVVGCEKKPPAAEGPPPEVLVTRVIQQDVPVYHEWIGTTDGFVNAEIRPKVAGYLLKQLYDEGGRVTKGQPLFQIDPRQFEAALQQAQGSLVRAQASLDKANLDVARYTPLAAEKAISQQELDDALTRQRSAKADVDSAQAAVDQAQLNLGWSLVASPIDGVAGIAKAQVGDLVDGSVLMTTVSTVDPIKVYFSISEQGYMRIAELISTGSKQIRDLPMDLVFEDGTIYPHKGRPILTDRQVNVKTGTITLAAEFPNPNNILRPGQYAKLRAVTNVKKGALLVPQRAVSELQGAYTIVVVGPDDTATTVVVKPAEQAGRLWVIDEGLNAGDQVVVEGIQRVKTGMKVSPKPAPVEPDAQEPNQQAAAGR
ncbi:MAG: efflux RND transporter periplasmic adaptor subunit [Acidobacteriota bacterium]